MQNLLVKGLIVVLIDDHHVNEANRPTRAKREPKLIPGPLLPPASWLARLVSLTRAPTKRSQRPLHQAD